MANDSQDSTDLPIVPDTVIPHGDLPPLRYRDLPEPVALRKMIGPGIILAGLALGSGEFIIWPYITYKTQFIFFWACVVGVSTQYFLNLEISRWTLATGESAITGFCRLSRHFAWIFLLCNVIPWMIPGWARGAAEMFSWLLWEPEFVIKEGTDVYVIKERPYVTPLAIGSLFLCGIVLTAGPVIYNTVEKIQGLLVGLVIVMVLVLAIVVVRADAVVAQLQSTVTLGAPDFVPGNLEAMLLLGALAFAGAGGTMNLGQSNYVKDKGYGMGQHIGRITSPITGQEESIAETGFHFPHDDVNLGRWKRWWSLTCREQFFTFFLTCLFCLVLLTLISYSLLYEPGGELKAGAQKYGQKMNFIFGEAEQLGSSIGPGVRLLFLIMGIAILLTTEFGVLDACTRVSTDIVKVNWLRDNQYWTESKLYYLFLWGLILFGTIILLVTHFLWDVASAINYITISAALNGGVMFLYSIILLILNRRILPAPLRMSWWRALILCWSVLFFGFFVFLTVRGIFMG